MSNLETEVPKERGTLKYFQKHRSMAIFWSALSLLIFLIVTYVTVPLFFTNFWLAPILFLLLVFTKSYGSWDAYAKMRKQTERMQEDLNNISKAVDKIK